MTSALHALVRSRFADAPAPPWRLGLEVEMLPVRVGAGGAPVPPQDTADGTGTLSVLRRVAAAAGWHEHVAGGGLPKFHLPDGALLTYEPGGQLEWSSPPHISLARLDASVCTIAAQLGEAFAAHGIALLSRGLDPCTPSDAAMLVTDAARYRRQLAHYRRRGPYGRRMMLQTAGIHVNIDPGADVTAAWDVLNALAPIVTAVFANSGVVDGTPAPHRSHRAFIWRGLDSTRTGVFAPVPDPAAAYAAFALDAESFLLGDEGSAPRPFGEWLAAGVTDAECEQHLSTLFPEVRPRSGYFELRACDALPARWAVVPGAIAWAAVHCASWRERLRRELPAATPARLMCAAERGVYDAALGGEARWVIAGTVEALQEATLSHALHELGDVARRVEEFGERFTLRGRDPGDEVESLLTD